MVHIREIVARRRVRGVTRGRFADWQVIEPGIPFAFLLVQPTLRHRPTNVACESEQEIFNHDMVSKTN